MPTILFSKASPYAAKVRMAARYVGYEADAVQTDTWTPTPEFLEANPLGKIPVLITADGRTILDSRVIMLFLDRWSGGKLFPSDPEARLAAEMLEARADGIADCLQAIMFERRYRPEERIHEPWIDRQWAKASRALDWLDREPPDLSLGLNAGHIALRGTVGYLAVRFEGAWEADRPRLVDWLERFDKAHPLLAELRPRPWP
jgi:glutathione S-transferase